MIADYKNPDNTTGAITAWTYLADVKNISNMYPYGKSYGTNATYNADEDYRYGFNGMEKEKNIGEGFSDFGARMYEDGRYFSRDKFESKFPFYSPYIHAANDPINVIDEDGNVWKLVNPQFQDNTEKTKAVISKLFNGKIRADITNEIVTIEFTKGNNENTLDKHQLELYETMQAIIGSRHEIKQEQYIDDNQLYVGAYQNRKYSYFLGSIDFGDIEKYFDSGVAEKEALGMLGHEIVEQFRRIFLLETEGLLPKYERDHDSGNDELEDITGDEFIILTANGTYDKGVFSGVYKLVMNSGGGTGFFPSLFRSLGIGQEPKFKTLETTVKEGEFIKIESKDGNTVDASKGDKKI